MEALKKQVIEERHQRARLEEVVPLKTPFIIFIDPCGACNFACNFCPCNKSSYKKEERHQKMSLETLQKIVDDICIFEEQVKVIYLYGFGEPLLNKDLFAMASYIKERKACRELRLVTNGSLLNPDVNRKLVDAGFDLIRISVEALEAESYKKMCGVNLNYDKFVANISDLYERSRGKVKIAAKIVNATLKTEEETERFFNIYKPITDFTFIEDIVAGWPEFEEMVMPDGAPVEADNWIWKRDHYNKCSFSLTMLMVHANGTVCACPNDWKMANTFGNAKQESLVDVWKSEKLKEFRLMHLEKDRRDIPFCRGCICSGYDPIDGGAERIAKRIREID